MEEKILEILEKYVELNDEEKESILQQTPYESFKKGTYLLKEGQISYACFFNLQGLVRQYEIIDGEERTTWFYTEGEALVAFESASKQSPCRFNWVCEEDTILVVGRFDRMEETYAQNPKLETMSRLFIGHDFGKYQDLTSSFITLSPEERYLLLREKRPDLLNRVPQYHIASYLGIKPETLSRIRKRLSQNR